MHSSKISEGFTLVELSVVITIIGLIIGGIMTGRELVKNSESRAIIAQMTDLKAAIRQFETLYNGLPGDLANASSFWSGATNGNGNKAIEGEPSDEAFMAFDHLSRAGIINGSFLGQWNGGFVFSALTGNNVVQLKRKGGAIYIRCCSNTDYARNLSFNNMINIFSISDSGNAYRGGIVTPVEALSIDQKMDDGNPDTGYIGGAGAYNAGYSAGDCYFGSGITAQYYSNDVVRRNLPSCQVLFAYDWN